MAAPVREVYKLIAAVTANREVVDQIKVLMSQATRHQGYVVIGARSVTRSPAALQWEAHNTGV